MKIKAGLVVGAAVLALALPAAAKEKGTPLPFDNWGVITLPKGTYIEAGTQPLLTAGEYGQDAAAMLERIYPVEPESYQVVMRDGAAFQYGYLLRYSVNVWEVEAAIDRQKGEKAFSRKAGKAPDIKALAEAAYPIMKRALPPGFSLKGPITAQKKKGHVFYECTLERELVVNQKEFIELVHVLAWQHGNTVEIAVIFGNDREGGDGLVEALTDMLKNAENMPKK